MFTLVKGSPSVKWLEITKDDEKIRDRLIVSFWKTNISDLNRILGEDRGFDYNELFYLPGKEAKVFYQHRIQAYNHDTRNIFIKRPEERTSVTPKTICFYVAQKTITLFNFHGIDDFFLEIEYNSRNKRNWSHRFGGFDTNIDVVNLYANFFYYCIEEYFTTNMRRILGHYGTSLATTTDPYLRSLIFPFLNVFDGRSWIIRYLKNRIFHEARSDEQRVIRQVAQLTQSDQHSALPRDIQNIVTGYLAKCHLAPNTDSDLKPDPIYKSRRRKRSRSKKRPASRSRSNYRRPRKYRSRSRSRVKRPIHKQRRRRRR